jgi:RNA polymerase sigma-70 factor (ECF subfamily)
MGESRTGHTPTMTPAVARSGGSGEAAALAGAPASPAQDVTATGMPLTPRRLYDTHFAFVWRNLRRLGVPDLIAEDAAQDVFLVVHRRWDSFDARWSSVETWLFGILLRVARNHRRSLKRRGVWFVPGSGDAVQTVASAEAGPADLVARREAAVLLERLLDALDDDKRAILVLVDIEQLSVPEAAEALGINLNTAYWRLRTARKRLDRALARMKATEVRSSREGQA